MVLLRKLFLLPYGAREPLFQQEDGRSNKKMAGETIDGGFAEYMLATAEHVYPVPETLGDAEAAPLFCPGLAAYGAVVKAGLSPGSEVTVFGVSGVSHLT